MVDVFGHVVPPIALDQVCSLGRNRCAAVYSAVLVVKRVLPAADAGRSRTALRAASNRPPLLLLVSNPTQVSCPNCNRKVAAGRFAPHLEKCMGRGRQASRAANKRLSTMEM